MAKAALRRCKDYQDTFTSESGIKVLRDMQMNFHMGSSIYAPGEDAMTMAYRDGQRSVVLHIISNLGRKLDIENLINELELSGQEYSLPDNGE